MLAGALTMIFVGNPFSAAGSPRSCCRSRSAGSASCCPRGRRQPAAEHRLLRRGGRRRPPRGARGVGRGRCGAARVGRGPAAPPLDTRSDVSIDLPFVTTYQGRGLSALADPTRRTIFERVAERPRAVGELAGELPVSRPAV